MPFPQDDHYWQEVADFLLNRFGASATIVAPNEFHELFPRTFPYDTIRHLDLDRLDALVIHKGALSEVGQDTCGRLAERGIPLYGNSVFSVFTFRGRRPWRTPDREHFDEFERRRKIPDEFKTDPVKQRSEFAGAATVILMTTYNRPNRLAQSLKTVAALNAPILVVNDGSDPSCAAAYAALYAQYDLRVLALPDNRGLSCALNAGLSYWLADPAVEWISYLQDDVEVRSDLLVALARVQDAQEYPLLTGRRHTLHKVYGEVEVNGETVLLQRMAAGIHLHAQRGYWESMLPIPSAYFQAPLRGLPRGADEDWWISLWSPRSIVKRGKYIAVLPDLVRTTTVLSADSTWGNPGLPDPPLPPTRLPTDNFTPAVLRVPPPPCAAAPDPIPANNFWHALAACFGQKAEHQIHPHAPEERAHFYHAIDPGSTELEVLNFINALVCLFKPGRVLETGTYLGFGSCAIAAGLKSNGRGHLVSIDIDAPRLAWAREHIEQFDPTLESWVTLVNGSSLDYLAAAGTEPFDLVFIDSDFKIRFQELKILCERCLFAPGAVCVIHDTSPLRIPTTEHPPDAAADLKDRHVLASLGPEFEVFAFPNSRGFHLLRYCGT
jgi:predicted O-methyltransferase YrrM